MPKITASNRSGNRHVALDMDDALVRRFVMEVSGEYSFGVR
jgi:hypothetical protein